jgi:hypothetical protein
MALTSVFRLDVCMLCQLVIFVCKYRGVAGAHGDANAHAFTHTLNSQCNFCICVDNPSKDGRYIYTRAVSTRVHARCVKMISAQHMQRVVPLKLT